jgi:hypothetical protein
MVATAEAAGQLPSAHEADDRALRIAGLPWERCALGQAKGRAGPRRWEGDGPHEAWTFALARGGVSCAGKGRCWAAGWPVGRKGALGPGARMAWWARLSERPRRGGGAGFPFIYLFILLFLSLFCLFYLNSYSSMVHELN